MPIARSVIGRNIFRSPDLVVDTSFSTTFSLLESPLNEGGRWVNGLLDGVKWNNVQSLVGEACGAVAVGGYDDCIAHVNPAYRTFAANQFAQGTVFRAPGYSPGVSHEIELLVRFSISNGDAHGYEILWGVTGECNVVRWNGGLGSYLAWNGSSGPNIGAAVDGDVLRAEIVGNQIIVKKNGVTVFTPAVENTWTRGQPGLGFWPTIGSVPASYGWKNYMAGDL